MDVDLAGLGAALSWLRKLLRLQTISGQSLTPPQFPLATLPHSRTPHPPINCCSPGATVAASHLRSDLHETIFPGEELIISFVRYRIICHS
jgi:hypothetical protein